MLCVALVLPGMSPGLTLDEAFRPGMVLQREVPYPITGSAEVDASVTVEFAGQSHKATADSSGEWRVTLDALAADASPSNLLVRSGSRDLVVSNLVVGDVWWVCGDSEALTLVFESARSFADALQLSSGVQVGLMKTSVRHLSPFARSGDDEAPAAVDLSGVMPSVPIGGVIWAPGDEDADDAYRYQQAMPKLVDSWRQTLVTPNNPLPVIAVESRENGSVDLAFLRDAQRAVWLGDDRMGFVATWDVGEDREAIAGRLLRWAKRLVLEDTAVAVSGPVFDAMRVKGRQAILTFTHDRGGLSFIDDEGDLRGLEMAGDDRLSRLGA